MSLILDALKRSDADRTDPAEIPGIHTRHGPDATSKRALQRWPVFLLVLALPLLLVLGWMQFAADDPLPPPATPPPATPPPATPPPVATKAAEAKVMAPPTESRASPVEAPGVNNEEQTAAVAALYASSPVIEDPAPEPAVTAARANREPPARQTLDVDAMASEAQRELARMPKPLEEHAVPLITDLSQSQKDQIPTVLYSAHHWNGTGANSWVMLNGRKVREGGAAGKGVRLDEILENSSVLSYQGTQFRLRSLNSWVNL